LSKTLYPLNKGKELSFTILDFGITGQDLIFYGPPFRHTKDKPFQEMLKFTDILPTGFIMVTVTIPAIAM